MRFQPKNNSALWHPRNWPSWLVVLSLYLLAFLPMSKKNLFAQKLGRLAFSKLKRRAVVTKRNLEICFPELSPIERNDIARESFVSTAEGCFEMLHLWWRDVGVYLDNMTVIGKEHLLDAQSRGTGVLLIGGHFGIVDLTLPLVGTQLRRPGYMYRPNNNPVINWMIESGRHRHFEIESFDKYELKQMIEFIKKGGEVWYAPDQDFGRHCDVFIPFFGTVAGCISTPSWIARESGATVLHVAPFRLPDGKFEVIFSPVFENFGQDKERDARSWNNALEHAIRRHPEQYLWQHKRFKTRPEGSPSIY